MLEIVIRDFHEIGDQFVAAFELDINLREGVLIPVPKRDEAVILPDEKQRQ